LGEVVKSDLVLVENAIRVHLGLAM